ncbi:hypothetical protein M0P48_00425 [Candidatus Gracilibacteria bacterium]|nr:hypothetical protein [Candidatus Gracilibacteria bacterium]
MKKGLIILLSAVFLLSGCSFFNRFKSERSRFIEATSDALCLIFNSDDPRAPSQETLDKSMEVFSEYGFNNKDEAGMKAISDKYNDEETNKTILKAIQECSGIDIESLATEANTTTTEPVLDEVAEPTILEEKPVK